MERSRISEFFAVADLAICSVWLLLLAHIDVNRGMITPLLLLFPGLRIWIAFLMQRRSKSTVVPLVMLSLMSAIFFLDQGIGVFLFVEPLIKLLVSVFALFNVEMGGYAYSQDLLMPFDSTNAINLIGCVWMILIPWGVYIYNWCKKQLQPSNLSLWKAIALCIYIFVIVMVDTTIMFEVDDTTSVVIILVLMILLIPIIFNRGDIKGLFCRSEIAYMLTLAMFFIGYVCGIGLELKSAITVCVFPAAFFALMNWCVCRATTYKDILLLFVASMVFWCAQYTTNMVRILLLLVSLAIATIPVIRFAIDTKKYWSSAGIYLIVALIMPVFCLGYNPYSVLGAKRLWHFDKYVYSKNGLLCVEGDGTTGLRDRFGAIFPVDEYENVVLLLPHKPFVKLGKDDVWQIYDIERRELVCDEWFDDVILCGERVYRLKSQKGDKYLTIPWYYSRYDEQSAIISDELPAEKDE